MTRKEFEIVVTATMQYVRRTYNVKSFTNAEIIKQVEKVIDNNFNLEINSWRKVDDDVTKVITKTNKGEKDMKKCCICGKTFTGWGHNPYPVKSDGECCSECNMQRVVPARLERLRMLENSK